MGHNYFSFIKLQSGCPDGTFLMVILSALLQNLRISDYSKDLKIYFILKARLRRRPPKEQFILSEQKCRVSGYRFVENAKEHFLPCRGYP